VREKYYSLADKPWLISQIRLNKHAERLKVALHFENQFATAGAILACSPSN